MSKGRTKSSFLYYSLLFTYCQFISRSVFSFLMFVSKNVPVHHTIFFCVPLSSAGGYIRFINQNRLLLSQQLFLRLRRVFCRCCVPESLHAQRKADRYCCPVRLRFPDLRWSRILPLRYRRSWHRILSSFTTTSFLSDLTLDVIEPAPICALYPRMESPT